MSPVPSILPLKEAEVCLSRVRETALGWGGASPGSDGAAGCLAKRAACSPPALGWEGERGWDDPGLLGIFGFVPLC